MIAFTIPHISSLSQEAIARSYCNETTTYDSDCTYSVTENMGQAKF